MQRIWKNIFKNKYMGAWTQTYFWTLYIPHHLIFGLKNILQALLGPIPTGTNPEGLNQT